MNYRSQLNRFLKRRISVEVWGRGTILGTLASIHDDHLRLKDTIIVSEHETHAWLERSQYSLEESPIGPRYAETIVRKESIQHVSCTDEDLQVNLLDDAQQQENSAAQPQVTNRIFSDDRNQLGQRANKLDLSESATQDSQAGPLKVQVDRIQIQLGPRLLELADCRQPQNLMSNLAKVRKEIAKEMGVILPRVRVVDSFELETDHSYRVRVNGRAVGGGELFLDKLLMIIPANASLLSEGVDGVEPAYGLPAKWIDPSERNQLEMLGGIVVTPLMALTTHFSQCVRNQLHELLDYIDVCELFENLLEERGTNLSELIPKRLSVNLLHRLLKSLLEEGVSIGCLLRIVENAACHSARLQNYDQLLQQLRIELGSDICAPLVSKDGRLEIVRMPEVIEEDCCQALATGKHWTPLEGLSEFQDSLAAFKDAKVIVVRRPETRRMIFEQLTRLEESLVVIAEAEIPRSVKLVELVR